MDHVWEANLSYLNRKGFNLAGPHRNNAVMNRCQWKTTNAIKQAAHGQCILFAAHLDTACTTVFVVLTAACAV